MKYNRKREIRLSLAQGAVFRIAQTIFEVEKLYLILKELYFLKLKLPLPNLKFFIELFKSSIGKVFIVIHENKIIGGSFCLFSKGDTIYTLYYCGLRNYHNKIFPTHLAILAAIDFGIENNLEYLDFMGAGLKEKEYGVRKYKQEFGSITFENGRFLKILQPFLYSLGKTGLKIYKKIKS
jgi:lipid II:glycine glycyltransferase (peptidoglycan interpeptide bridge formation enzyme)